MSKISSMMDTGKRSMMNSQTALQTVGHNIANKSTEGYSRQRVDVESNLPIGEGSLRIGTGSKAVKVSRTNNPFLEKQIQKENSNQGFLTSRSDALSGVEQVYNEQQNKGLNQYFSDFFNSIRELSNYPESTATRTLVRESAEGLVQDFHRVKNQLENVQLDLDTKVQNQVEEINQISKQIAELNEKIQTVEIQGIEANDERDKRDLLLKQLNERVDISWAEGKNGQVAVTAGKTALLVSGYTAVELKAIKTGDRGRTEIFYENPPGTTSRVITDQFKGGSIGGTLDVRDHIAVERKTDIDHLAEVFMNHVNEAHSQGYDLHGRKGGNLFELVDKENGAGSGIQVNREILNDANRIVSGIKPNAPADNTVANVISSLQDKQILSDGSSTIDEFYNTQVGQIGIVAQRANKSAEAQKDVVNQLSKIRESISGVSLDEEATKMIEYQKSFDASARLIRTADEMLDTVLNLKHL
jgi:flagellar hook-associated protein 1 FlgK